MKNQNQKTFSTALNYKVLPSIVRVGEGIVVEFSSNVLFGFDKSDLSADAKINLNKLVKILEGYPDTNI
ncbi:MAG: hypothetical protein Q7U47_15065, partial [Paludibacter sp.]|nr:hypothetical protein [Paludibacter sp.]